jgi:hypothetical protein
LKFSVHSLFFFFVFVETGAEAPAVIHVHFDESPNDGDNDQKADPASPTAAEKIEDEKVIFGRRIGQIPAKIR